LNKIVVVGDTHIGSVYGLAHPSSVAEEKANAFLHWIFQSWQQFCRKHQNPDYLILMGDMADGSQTKALGVDALSTDTDVQVDMAKTLLNMLVPAGKTRIYGITGSGYHAGEGQATNIDRRVTEAVGGEYKGSVFEFDIEQERIQVAHGGTASMVNPSTYIQREINLSKTDAQKRKVKGPTILLRGHQHRFYMIQDDSGVYGVLNGCWQYTTPFMTKKSANITPSFGGTIIEINEATKIYRAEFLLPEDVRREMVGYEKLNPQRERLRKAEDLRILKETLRSQKL
jgi:hypothetical protein